MTLTEILQSLYSKCQEVVSSLKLPVSISLIFWNEQKECGLVGPQDADYQELEAIFLHCAQKARYLYDESRKNIQ